MTLNSGMMVEDYTGTYLVLRGIPPRDGCVVETEDVPYIKLSSSGRGYILEYIYVPERMRGHKLSLSLLEVLFEYQEKNKIDFLKFECICKPFWRKVSAKFPKRIFFPPTVLQKTNVAVVRLPHIRPSAIKIGKL